jgi:hypothetical protein
MQGLSIVPSLFVSLESDDSISRVKELADLYESDLPSPECLESEVHSWHIKWQQQLREHGESSLPTSLTATLRHVGSMYPNITAIIKILCTLPVTRCSAERSFSGLKRILTPFRSTMTNSRLTGLTLLHIHRDIPIDIKAAINTFARMHPRRMRMVEILDDQDQQHEESVA